MTPLPNYPQQSRQFHYNEKLCKARSVVERFFGVFKGTWRCLSYQRVLMYAPEIAGQIVNACAVLHNMRLYYRLPFDIEEDLQNEYAEPGERDNGAAEIQDAVPRRAPRAVAQRIKRQIMREWFPNYYCAWDNDRNE